MIGDLLHFAAVYLSPSVETVPLFVCLPAAIIGCWIVLYYWDREV